MKANPIFAIEQCIYQFWIALDRNDYSAVLALLTPDCRWRRDDWLEGHEAISRALHARPRDRVTRHLVSNLRLVRNGTDWIASYLLTAFAGQDTGGQGAPCVSAAPVILADVEMQLTAAGMAQIARIDPCVVFSGPRKRVELMGTIDNLADRPAASPKKLAHVVLRTRDNYEAMIEWYGRVLNARTVFASQLLTFLTYDDEHHRIAIARQADLQPRAARLVGVDHLAFTYESLEDLLGTHARLEKQGIKPFCAVNHGPTTSLYYHDPDGNRIELQVDNFSNLAEATEHMAASFKVNPVGVLIDPQHLAARLESGISAAELTRLVIEKLEPPAPELVRQLTSD
jgi:catechol 2,3-dioxygenase-like lactoylglutathione lyase family enzyme